MSFYEKCERTFFACYKILYKNVLHNFYKMSAYAEKCVTN